MKTESQIREELSEQLGVEFATPEELEAEQKTAEPDLEKAREAQPRVVKHEIKVNEIIAQCNEAISKMSNKNPHKYLIYLTATALSQMCDRCARAEKQLAKFQELVIKES